MISLGAKPWSGQKHLVLSGRWWALESVERGIPRDGYKVLDSHGQRDRLRDQRVVCALSDQECGSAYVPCEFSVLDSEVAVEIRNQPVKCKVVPIPFYKRPKKQS